MCSSSSVFSVFSIRVSAVPPPDSEAGGVEANKEVEVMVAVGVVEDMNGWLTDADCFETFSSWHVKKSRAELGTEQDAKLVVQLESPLGTAKGKTLVIELETELSRLGIEKDTVLAVQLESPLGDSKRKNT